METKPDTNQRSGSSESLLAHPTSWFLFAALSIGFVVMLVLLKTFFLLIPLIITVPLMFFSVIAMIKDRKSFKKSLEEFDLVLREHIHIVTKKTSLRRAVITYPTIIFVVSIFMSPFVGVYFVPDPLCFIFFGYFVFAITTTLIVLVICSKKAEKQKQSFKEPQKAEGVVFRCTESSSQHSGRAVGGAGALVGDASKYKTNTYNYHVEIVIPEVDRFLVGNSSSQLQRGSKVKIEYDKSNPKLCKIIS